jgi:hypothetical protein
MYSALQNLPKPVNTDAFRRAAIYFDTYGVYTTHPRGTAAYFDYWEEQLNRCRNGYTANGVRITGHHYFYLNFCRIKLADDSAENTGGKKQVTKSEEFPAFWDGDYYFFHALEYASLNGLHLMVAKARRKGYSYKSAAIAVNVYNTTRKSKTLICAHDGKYLFEDGTMDMVTSYMDFINEHTAWTKRRQVKDTAQRRRASYKEKINGQWVEKGYKSEVQGISFMDNPNAGRGKDCNLIIFEECGTFPNLEKTYMAMKPSTEDNGIVTGTMLLFGTGGDMEGGALDFERMFLNPRGYQMLAFDNIWDEGATGTDCGFFVPSYLNRKGFMDNDGNTDIEASKELELEEREKMKQSSTDPTLIDRHVAEYPHNPREAFLKSNQNIFPVAGLQDWKNHLIRTKLNQTMAIHGTLDDSGPTPVFKKDSDARPVIKFPHDQKSDNRGCISIYFPPFRDSSGQVPKDLYIVVHDPYAFDKGPSLGAAYVIKRMNNFSQPDDIIVASYVGRPEFQDEYNRNLFLLAEFYNARIAFENDRGDVIGYAKRTHQLRLLMPEVEILDKKESVTIRKLGRNWGMSMGTAERKNQAAIYLRDWLKRSRGKDPDGKIRYNYHYIYDLALLEELIKFGDGNFDRVSALLIGMYYLKDLSNRAPAAPVEEEEKTLSLFERDLF